jgi:hypothetical protein
MKVGSNVQPLPHDGQSRGILDGFEERIAAQAK